jgi:hypothetical protein
LVLQNDSTLESGSSFVSRTEIKMVTTARRKRRGEDNREQEVSVGDDCIVYFPGDLEVGRHLPSIITCSVKR